jgi:hypothetical protein
MGTVYPGALDPPAARPTPGVDRQDGTDGAGGTNSAKKITQLLVDLDDKVLALEAKVGVSGSNVITSLDYISGRNREQVATFARTGALTVATGAARFRFPWDVTLLGVTGAVNTAPTGAAIIFDVKRNGTSIFTTTANRPTIAIGAFATTVEPAPDIVALTAGQYLTVDIVQIGSTVPGADLTAFVRYRRT